jgi:hypothetical protein
MNYVQRFAMNWKLILNFMHLNIESKVFWQNLHVSDLIKIYKKSIFKFYKRNLNCRQLFYQISLREATTINYQRFCSRLKVLFKIDNKSTQIELKFLPITKNQLGELS